MVQKLPVIISDDMEIEEYVSEFLSFLDTFRWSKLHQQDLFPVNASCIYLIIGDKGSQSASELLENQSLSEYRI